MSEQATTTAGDRLSLDEELRNLAGVKRLLSPAGYADAERRLREKFARPAATTPEGPPAAS